MQNLRLALLDSPATRLFRRLGVSSNSSVWPLQGQPSLCNTTHTGQARWAHAQARSSGLSNPWGQGPSGGQQQPQRQQQRQYGLFKPNMLLGGGRYKLQELWTEEGDNGRVPSILKGHSTTVWRGQDLQKDEPVLLQCMEAGDTASYTAGMREAVLHAAAGRHPNILGLLDAFEHRSSSGRHPVMVLEPHGGNTLAQVIQVYQSSPFEHNPFGGIRHNPRALREIAKDLLLALRELHRRNIVHMAVAPSNVVLSHRFENDTALSWLQWALRKGYSRVAQQAFAHLLQEESERGLAEGCVNQVSLCHASFMLRDLQHAVLLDSGRSAPQSPAVAAVVDAAGPTAQRLLQQVPVLYDAQGMPLQQDLYYQPPEEILGMGDPVAPSYDIWTLGCLLYEAATGQKLFAPTDLRRSVERNRGDTGYSESHFILAKMVHVLGSYPRGYAHRCSKRSEYFSDSRLHGDMLRIHAGPLHTLAGGWSLSWHVQQHTQLSDSEKSSFALFLDQMLKWEPKQRATAEQLLEHPWLHSW